MAPIVLGYWKIRAIGQPIRLMLAYTGRPWVDKLYVAEPTPPYGKDEWFKEKFTLGLDFPNLPYYLDGDLKLSQSKAILRHIARQNDLSPVGVVMTARIEMVEEELFDFFWTWIKLCYFSENFEASKPEFVLVMGQKFEQFSTFLGNGSWLAGDQLTYVDFVLYELLDQLLTFEPNCLQELVNLKQFHERFENLEKIAVFQNSSRFIKFPINNPVAHWGGINDIKTKQKMII